jgi:hypothetical protein
MPQSRQILFIGLFIFTLLVPACQSQPDETAGDEQQPPDEKTSVSQVVTATTTSPPTATPARSLTPSPIPTNSPTTSPTHTPIPPPTPTAIPVDAPSPAATNIPTPPPTAASPPDEVDLVTLEESLALLDRVERRIGPPSISLPLVIVIYAGQYRLGDDMSNPDPNPFVATFLVPRVGESAHLAMTAAGVDPDEEPVDVYLNGTWITLLDYYVDEESSTPKAIEIPLDPGLIKIGSNEIKIEDRLVPGEDLDDFVFWDLKLVIQ